MRKDKNKAKFIVKIPKLNEQTKAVKECTKTSEAESRL